MRTPIIERQGSGMVALVEGRGWDRATQSILPKDWTPEEGRFLNYWERMAIEAIDLNPQTVVMIGGGLATILMMMRKMGYVGWFGIVEPDPRVIEMGQKEGTYQLADKVWEMTGEQWAKWAKNRKRKEKYDLCILDAFQENEGHYGVYETEEKYTKQLSRFFVHCLANPRGGMCLKYH